MDEQLASTLGRLALARDMTPEAIMTDALRAYVDDFEVEEFIAPALCDIEEGRVKTGEEFVASLRKRRARADEEISRRARG